MALTWTAEALVARVVVRLRDADGRVLDERTTEPVTLLNGRDADVWAVVQAKTDKSFKAAPVATVEHAQVFEPGGD